MLFGSDSNSGYMNGFSINSFEHGDTSVLGVEITRVQIKKIVSQSKVAGEFRLADSVIGELEQILVNDLLLSRPVRLALSQLFGKSLRIIPGSDSPVWPTEWLRDNVLQATNTKSGYRTLLASDPLCGVSSVPNRAQIFASIPLCYKPVIMRCLPDYIEGGDMLPIGDKLFVGMNSILRSRYIESVQAKRAVNYEDTRQRFIDRLSYLFGREVVVLDNMDLPVLFHLDMYASAVLQADGNPKFFIGNIQEFIDDIAGMSAQTMKEEQAFYDWFREEEARLGGQPNQYHFNFEQYLHDVRYGRFREQYVRVQQRLDKVKEMLVSNFDVESVPLPYVAQDPSYSEPKATYLPDAVRGKKDLCYDEEALVFSPLNTIVSCGLHGGKLRQKMYGAAYGFRRVDNFFAQKLSVSGTSLHLAPGFTAEANKGGGLHCLTSEWRKDFIASGTVWDKLGQLI